MDRDELVAEWRREAEQTRKHRRGWTGDEEHFGYLDGKATALEAVADELEQLDEKSIEEVYRDRNLLACAFAQMVPWGGYAEDPESPDDWAIVFGETPYGQVSWHVPLEMAERLNIPEREYEWDGHDREQKNDVLASWTQDGCPF